MATITRWFLIALIILLCAVPVLAADMPPAPGTKTLNELDALRLEKAELAAQAIQAEISRLQERLERVKEQAVGYVREIQRRDGTEGWNLDLGGRKWTRPPEKTEEK